MPFVLVVDDDSAVRRMILLLLRSEGYAKLETAKDGAEALALMRQQRPCLVLLDINMPLMDGWEFRKHQLEDPALADVPVICMTGWCIQKTLSASSESPVSASRLTFPR